MQFVLRPREVLFEWKTAYMLVFAYGTQPRCLYHVWTSCWERHDWGRASSAVDAYLRMWTHTCGVDGILDALTLRGVGLRPQ